MDGRRTIARAGLLFITSITLMTSALAQPQTAADANSKSVKQPLKVGFILSGPVTDLGWNYAHEQGRLYLEKALPGKTVTTVAEKISENAEAERVMEKMVAQGTQLIFSTSYGYLESALRVAKRHPSVRIMQCSERTNPCPTKNVGTYFASYAEQIYVAGTVAGHMTKKNEIGYVAAFPIPALLVSLNAFTLGARSVNPKVKVHVVWTNSWSDPPLESEATRALVDQGADIIVGDLTGAIPTVQTAEKCGVYSVAYDADLHELAPKGWLTGVHFNWGPLYVKLVQSVFNGDWHPEDYRYGIKYGYLLLSTFGKSVPPSIKAEALDLLEKIKTGKFAIFKGPIKDRDGKIVIPAGQTASETSLEKIDWVVSGVYGNLPRKR